MFNKKSLKKNQFMLDGKFKKNGYDWWWHSLTGIAPDGSEKAFFIEYFMCNPSLSPDKVILGQSSEEARPSYVMVKCGAWGENKKQLHRFYAWNEVKIEANSLVADGCSYAEDHITGNVVVENATPAMLCDNGSMSWDLKVDKQIAYNVGYGTSDLFRFLKAFQMYWHAQGMKTKYEGTITYEGVTYTVSPDTSYGYADKNWGSNFTSPWVWLSSNNVTRRSTGEKLNNTVFDIGGGKPRAFGITFNRKLLGAYYIEGEEYEMNFSKFLHPSKTEFSYEVGEEEVHWVVTQSNKKAKIVTNVFCKKDDMIYINYESPDGFKRYEELWNCGHGYGYLEIYKKQGKEYVLADTLDIKNVGCEYGEYAKRFEK